MTGVAASLASAARQSGTTLGVAIAGALAGPALSRGPAAFTAAGHAAWWLCLALGIAILALALLSTTSRAAATARRAAAQFAAIDAPQPGEARPERPAVRMPG